MRAILANRRNATVEKQIEMPGAKKGVNPEACGAKKTGESEDAGIKLK